MSDDAPLYQRDQQAWQERLAEGNRLQPRKRVGTDVIIRDSTGRILIVDPTYKSDWDLPGGMAEANEPPHQAAQRELREELGLRLDIHRLLWVDWVSPHGPWDDSLMFIFDGGTLPDEQITQLRPVDPELSQARFVTLDQARHMLRPYVWQRAFHALESLRTGRVRYLKTANPSTTTIHKIGSRPADTTRTAADQQLGTGQAVPGGADCIRLPRRVRIATSRRPRPRTPPGRRPRRAPGADLLRLTSDRV